MFLQTNFVLLAIAIIASAPIALGRELILERDGRPVFLARRRFGQENSPTLDDIRAACPGGLCATIAGKAVSALLAGADPCAQQAISEELIESSSQFDQETADKMIAAAVAFRQAEKNTPPDFSQNPPALRNSVFCLTPPKFPQLEGLNQAQDPSNDPNLFFDPITKSTALKGSQANTFPLGSNGQVSSGAGASEQSSSSTTAVGAAATQAGGLEEVAEPASTADASGACPAAVTVTVSGTATSAPTEPAVTVTVGGAAAATTATATTSGGNNGGNPSNNSSGDGNGQTGAAGDGASGGTGGADFGICSTPEIEFGVGFDDRKETSFQPKDKTSFNHGSAQNINIITQFICDELTNKCKANQAAKDLCAQAEAAAAAAPPKTGQQADEFNAIFGIQSNFAVVTAIDDQGRVVAGSAGNTAGNTGATNSGDTNNGGNGGGNQTGSTGSGTNTGANTGANTSNTNNRTSNSGSNNTGSSQSTTNNDGSKNAGGNAGTAGANNAGANLQTFAGNLGVEAPTVTAAADGKFQVEGNAAFNELKNAVIRSCDVQNNQCANAANASGNKGGLTVAACNQQQALCISQAGGQ